MKRIEILGPGCPKCTQMAKNADEAARALGIGYEIVKITDLGVMMGYRVMATPAIVVDGEVKSSGKLLSPEEIKKHLA
jgi:small redox-active disulfide protein 2